MLCVRARVAGRWRARVYPLAVLRRETEPPAGWIGIPVCVSITGGSRATPPGGTHFESSEALGKLLVLATSTALNCFVIEGGEIVWGIRCNWCVAVPVPSPRD